jgi:hypothetical protein
VEASVAYVANRLSHRYGFGCKRQTEEPLIDDPVCASLRVSDEWLAQMDKSASTVFENLRKGLH